MKSQTNFKLNKSIKTIIKDEEIIKIAQKQRDYIGILKNDELMDDITKARQLFTPDPVYGYRLGKSIAVISNVRPGQGMDLHITDSSGTLKNKINDKNIDHKLIEAKNKEKKIIAFFGGSTMMGQGSQLPEYTIPSIVERTLKEKYNFDTLCINKGVGGICSLECFYMLISETIKIKPDLVVFYDGWNCCSYLTIMNALSQVGQHQDQMLHKGLGIRHYQHLNSLRNQYNFINSFKRTFNLGINNILTKLSVLLKSKYFRNKCRQIVQHFFPIRPHSFHSNFLENEDIDIQQCVNESVADYINIHNNAHLNCENSGIKFLTFFQPHIYWGKKQLTEQEKFFKDSNNEENLIFQLFYNKLNSSKLKNYFHKITSVFDKVKDEVYMDTGHVNKNGSYIISEHISKIIFKELKK